MKAKNLIYSTSKKVGRKEIEVNIRLSGRKPGQEYFSITGTVYGGGGKKVQTDKNIIMTGCIHETILHHFPQFEPFVRLHLADLKGVPLFAIENGFYHLTKGFDKEKPGSAEFAKKFCECYRIPGLHFDRLDRCTSSAEYAFLLAELGIPQLWKKEADEAIKLLEVLIGQQSEIAE